LKNLVKKKRKGSRVAPKYKSMKMEKFLKSFFGFWLLRFLSLRKCSREVTFAPKWENEGRRVWRGTRKTLKMPENTGFLGGVVANWLQKSVASLLSEWFEYVYRECRRGICGISYIAKQQKIYKYILDQWWMRMYNWENNFGGFLHVKFNCNGEKCKINIAGVIFSFILGVCPFVDT